MRVIPGNAQDIGSRQEQQDAFGFTDIDDTTFVAHGGVLAIVADGMGGLAMGRQASQRAVDTFLHAYMEKRPDEEIPEALMRALHAANSIVVQIGTKENLGGHIGTTGVAAVIHHGQLHWVSVGDSRLYLYRQGALTQLTTDHAFAAELAKAVQAGVISQEEAERHPERRSLMSYIGKESLTQIDSNTIPLPLEKGDRLLLCSDGLYGTLNLAEMAAVLEDDPQSAAEALKNAALKKQRSHQDNITAVVMGWGDERGQQQNSSMFPGLNRTQLHRYAILVLVVLLVGMLWLFIGWHRSESGTDDYTHSEIGPPTSSLGNADPADKEGRAP
ncbi:MAG: serine/threonine-protein phosphatase [Deltaproteobacteria bacterium]|nr:serine/threonine-protein phosphatase [Deltaproteobacteria bacterium]